MRFEDFLDIESVKSGCRGHVIYVYNNDDDDAVRYLQTYAANYGYPFGPIGSFEEVSTMDQNYSAIFPKLYSGELYVVFVTSNGRCAAELSDIALFFSPEYIEGVHAVVDLFYVYDGHRGAPSRTELETYACQNVWMMKSEVLADRDCHKDETMDFLGLMSLGMIQNARDIENKLRANQSKVRSLNDIRVYDMVTSQNNSFELNGKIDKTMRDRPSEWKSGHEVSDDRLNEVFMKLDRSVNDYVERNSQSMILRLTDMPMDVGGYKKLSGRNISPKEAVRELYRRDIDMWEYIDRRSYDMTMSYMNASYGSTGILDLFEDIPYDFWDNEGAVVRITNKFREMESMTLEIYLSGQGKNPDRMSQNVVSVTEPVLVARQLETNGYFPEQGRLSALKAVWAFLHSKITNGAERAKVREAVRILYRDLNRLSRSVPHYQKNKPIESRAEFLQRWADERNIDVNKQWKFFVSPANSSMEQFRDVFAPVRGIGENTCFAISMMPY